MSEPFIGQIMMAAFDFNPRNWAKCDGELIEISQNNSLFALLGTTYGGDGRTNFALPDMRGRTPYHRSQALRQGSYYGFESVALTTSNIPSHTHQLNGSTNTGEGGGKSQPFGVLLASQTESDNYVYKNASPNTSLSLDTIGDTGEGSPHNNMQPSLVIGFYIAIIGIWPSRN